MVHRNWDDLLYDYFTEGLSADDERLLQQMLADNPRRQNEFELWQRLRSAVRDEAETRLVDELPTFTERFYRELDAVDTLPIDPLATQEAPRQPETPQPTLRPARSTTRHLSLPMIAAAAAVFMLVAFVAIIATGGAGDLHFATALRHTPTPPTLSFKPTLTPDAGLDTLPEGGLFVPRPSVTPGASPTWPASAAAPTRGMGAPAETSSPVPLSGTMPPRDPVASITPSVNQPIVAAPARLVADAFLASGDGAHGVAYTGGGILVVQGMNGVWLFEGGTPTGAARVLSVPPAGLVDLTTSQTGSLIAGLTWENGLRLWDATDGELLVELPGVELWDDLQFSQDDQLLVSRLHRGAIRIDPEEPSQLSREQIAETIPGEFKLHIAPTGDLLAMVGDMSGLVIVLDVATGAEVSRFEVPAANARAAVISPDGQVLALGMDDGYTRLYELPSGKLIAETPHAGRVSALAFDPAGDLLAMVVETRPVYSLRVWNLQQDAVYAPLTYDLDLGDPAFSPDGTKLAAATPDGRVMVLDITGLR
ncbi:MAG: hypothetical protein ACOCYT_03715 [Chloroflexota bacterium]